MIIIFHNILLFALIQKKRLEWPIKKQNVKAPQKENKYFPLS